MTKYYPVQMKYKTNINSFQRVLSLYPIPGATVSPNITFFLQWVLVRDPPIEKINSVSDRLPK